MKTIPRTTLFSNEMADRHGLPRYYKVVRKNGVSTHANVRWSLPKEGGPGEWMRVSGKLILCRNGIHAARLADILRWYYGPTLDLYEIELDEHDMLHSGNKVCSRSGRLVRRVEFDREWVRKHGDEFANPEDRWGMPETEVRAATAALHMLKGSRQLSVDGMIEQLLAEQLAA